MSSQPVTPVMSPAKILLFEASMLITGSINTAANKLQQSSSSMGIDYVHQKFITFTMFLSETICLWIYLINKRIEDKKKEKELAFSNIDAQPLFNDSNQEITNPPKEIKEKEQNKKPKPKLIYFAIPAAFDFFGSSITTLSLTFLPSSVFQMFRGAIIIFTVTGAILFLKSRYHRHHFLGMGIVILGLIIVGLNAIVSKSNNDEKSGSTILIGIVVILVGQFFSACTFVAEEKLLKWFDTPTLQLVGMEGVFGASFYVVLLIPFYFIRCDNWSKDFQKMCQPENAEKTEYRFEDPILALKQLAHNWKIVLYCLLYITSIALFNYTGNSVTKFVSSTSRTIIDTLRTILVWGFFLTPAVPHKIQEKFSFLQLGGFFILVCGSLIYNEVVEIPYWGFDRNTKRAIKEREKYQLDLKNSEELKNKDGNN